MEYDNRRGSQEDDCSSRMYHSVLSLPYPKVTISNCSISTRAIDHFKISKTDISAFSISCIDICF